MRATHVKKKGVNRDMFTSEALLLTTACKSLGAEESFGEKMMPHSYLMSNFSCSTLLGLLCHMFCFMLCQMFSISRRSGLKAGQVSSTSKSC